jgi:hypothetical protein
MAAVRPPIFILQNFCPDQGNSDENFSDKSIIFRTYFAFGPRTFGEKSFGLKYHSDQFRFRSNFVRRSGHWEIVRSEKRHSEIGHSEIRQCTYSTYALKNWGRSRTEIYNLLNFSLHKTRKKGIGAASFCLPEAGSSSKWCGAATLVKAHILFRTKGMLIIA